mgnify:CR=1 FL=1
MLILVINCGSSSVKYQLIQTDTGVALARGTVERIGMSAAVISISRSDGYEAKFGAEILDHIAAIEQILTYLVHPKHGVIKDKSEIEAVGHRVVHGGQRFTSSVLIDEEVIGKIRQCIELAPLHNPHNIRGINAALRNLPGLPQVAVFDTAFHSTLPRHSFLYPIPYVLYRKYEIRRYGFHGMSHSYVYNRAIELSGGDKKKMKVITAHLGNGCSITAVDGGKSVDTSMGLTPLEGLVMGTRCGDVDPSIILHIMGREELTLAEANTPEFIAYAKQIVKNAKALAERLLEHGFDLVSGGTDNHLILIDLRNKGIPGKKLSKALDRARIVTNCNTIPGDPAPPFNPSGLRIGTPAITSRGMKEAQAVLIADFISKVAENIDNEAVIENVAKQALLLCTQFPVPEHFIIPHNCLLYTSPSPRDLSTSRMPSSA